jgi:hypothetical protein
MSARTAARLAWSLWALSVALTGLSLLLLVLILRYPNSYIFDWWLGNALVVVDATVGAIVVLFVWNRIAASRRVPRA